MTLLVLTSLAFWALLSFSVSSLIHAAWRILKAKRQLRESTVGGDLPPPGVPIPKPASAPTEYANFAEAMLTNIGSAIGIPTEFLSAVSVIPSDPNLRFMVFSKRRGLLASGISVESTPVLACCETFFDAACVCNTLRSNGWDACVIPNRKNNPSPRPMLDRSPKDAYEILLWSCEN